MHIDPTTGAMINGSMSITGGFYYDTGEYDENWNPISQLYLAGPTLLSGELSQFCSYNDSDRLDLVFNVTGGTLVNSPYLTVDGTFPNTKVGAILNSTGFSSHNWNESFTNVPTDLEQYAILGSVDLFSVPVPEPSTWVLLSTLVIGGYAAFRRHKVS